MAEVADSASPGPWSSSQGRYNDGSDYFEDEYSPVPEQQRSSPSVLNSETDLSSSPDPIALQLGAVPAGHESEDNDYNIDDHSSGLDEMDHTGPYDPVLGDMEFYHDLEIMSDDEDLFVDDAHDRLQNQNREPPTRLQPQPIDIDHDDDDDVFEDPGLVGRRGGRERDQLVRVEVEGRRVARGRERPAPAQPDVIDLTIDDSPPRPAAQNLSQNSQNIRRRRSQQRSTPPRLARSDGNYMGGHAPVIDLISSDDEPSPAHDRRNNNNNNNNNPRNPPENINRHNHGRGARSIRFVEPPRPQAQNRNVHNEQGRLHAIQNYFLHQVPFFRLAAMAANNPANDDLIMLGDRQLGHPPAPAPAPALGQIHLDYLANPFPPPLDHGAGRGAAAPARPPHEPPKPARPGFTRDTGEDVVAICPSCELELAYDPDGDDEIPAAPVKKQQKSQPKSRKDKAEHHFWAVKACGHVYCKKCFDNRRPSGKNPVPVGFQSERTGSKTKIVCAVEDCESDVGSKSAWVGIFM